MNNITIKNYKDLLLFYNNNKIFSENTLIKQYIEIFLTREIDNDSNSTTKLLLNGKYEYVVSMTNENSIIQEKAKEFKINKIIFENNVALLKEIDLTNFLQ